MVYKVAGDLCEYKLDTLDSYTSMPPPCKSLAVLGSHQKARFASKNDTFWSRCRSGRLGQSGQLHPASDGFLVLHKVAGASCESQLITLDSYASLTPPSESLAVLGNHQKARFASKNDTFWSWSRIIRLGQSGPLHPASDGFTMVSKLPGDSCELKVVSLDP